jgi:hypothetical protein
MYTGADILHRDCNMTLTTTGVSPSRFSFLVHSRSAVACEGYAEQEAAV